MSGFRDLDLKGLYFPDDRPLEHFYVPTLSRAVAYDRIAGYFRSTALAASSKGVSRFINGGGMMRMVVGAELRDEDLSAILDGSDLADVVAARLEQSPLEAADAIAEQRLATLAWLVREGRLEIRVGVPTDQYGKPRPAHEAAGYFHAKVGLLTDSDGNRVAFSGSVNESASAWTQNLEQIQVYSSWEQSQWETYGAPLEERFERFWNGHADEGWAILDLPEAVREDLVKRAPPADSLPPGPDPGERDEEHERRVQRERDVLRFVREAPRADGGTGVGFSTAGVEPFPHQTAIAHRAVETFPRGYLFADEVGLGKTIEAGLVLRELLLSGSAERALLLVPKSVIKQWQQELSEKLAMEVPRLESGGFLDVSDHEVDWEGGNPWSAFAVVLATSHLARRRERRQQVLEAGPWDVVLVDEAHHARRRGKTEEPNALLRLLREMKAAKSWQALYLASATPMQMNAHEAWDLLDLLGLSGRWGHSADEFVDYYTELRADFEERDWALLSQMAQDYRLDGAARTDEALAQALKVELGMAGSKSIREVGANGITVAGAAALDGAGRQGLDAWLRAHTPMRDRVFRTTRQTLRRYKEEGLMDATVNIPVREVKDQFVPMTPHEAELYRRIETYISRFYDAYREAGGQKRRALGFIMTVYRRRLTSSFMAVRLSLERRLEALGKRQGVEALLDADDLAALEGSVSEESVDALGHAEGLAEELAELRAFLSELEKQPPNESKMEYLLTELNEAFLGPHDTVLVFTQYTDTMDYIRGQLVTQFGDGVGCYSGRGGEVWDGEHSVWVPTSKETVKDRFRAGTLRILIGTDSLSEGLNLQTCGRMINYDMPWNFMRVEQRIGRIDRIGGRPRVHISNYFYKDTVEEQIYRGIAEDFEWFEDVVGPAQPVLHQIESAIEDVAMLAPSEQRAAALEQRVAAIQQQIEAGRRRPVTLEDMESDARPGVEPDAVIDLPALESLLVEIEGTGELLERHPDVGGAYLLTTPPFAGVPVTFRRDVLEEHSPDVRLLSYLMPEFEALMTRLEEVVG